MSFNNLLPILLLFILGTFEVASLDKVSESIIMRSLSARAYIGPIQHDESHALVHYHRLA